MGCLSWWSDEGWVESIGTVGKHGTNGMREFYSLYGGSGKV